MYELGARKFQYSFEDFEKGKVGLKRRKIRW